MKQTGHANLHRAFQFAWWGGMAVLAIAYCVLIPLKRSDLLPPEMTWSRVVLGPLILVAYLLINMHVGLWKGVKYWVGLFGGLFLLVLICVIVYVFDPVPK